MNLDLILVLAGGLGTRSENPSVPKINQSITNSRDIASFLIERLKEFADVRIVFLLSHHAEQVAKRLGPLPQNYQIVVDNGTGTADAVQAISSKLINEKVMVLLGDCIIGAPLKDIVDGLPNDETTYFFGRLTDHPEDSDILKVDEGNQIFDFIEKGTFAEDDSSLAYGLSGITITDAQVLRMPLANIDLQLNIYLNAKKLGRQVELLKNSWYIRDSGTPMRLDRLRRDFLSGAFNRRSAKMRSAIFLDRDGTLVPNIGESRSSVAKHEVPMGIVDAIRSSNQKGIPIFLVTNQPGIAKGFINFADFFRSMVDLTRALQPAILDDFYFCPHHPERGWEGEVKELKFSCACRKPKPGLLLRAAKEHHLDLSKSFVIGDSSSDELAARVVNANFLYGHWSVSGLEVADKIFRAVEEIVSDTN